MVHAGDVSDEKQQEAMHRALSGMGARPPSLAPAAPAIAPPVAPPALSPTGSPTLHKFFPGVMNRLKPPGMPKMMSDGGEVKDDKSKQQPVEAPTGQWVAKGSDPEKRKAAADSLAKAFGMSDGGKVPVMTSPGEVYLDADKAEKVVEGKKALESGEKIAGKAKIEGDSPKNDTVPKALEVGGIVIPRSLAESGDAKKLMDFVAAELAKDKK